MVRVIDIVHQCLFQLPDRHIEEHIVVAEHFAASFSLILGSLAPDESGWRIHQRIGPIEIVYKPYKFRIFVAVFCNAGIGLGEMEIHNEASYSAWRIFAFSARFTRRPLPSSNGRIVRPIPGQR